MLLVAFPRTPVYGGYPLKRAQPFRRARPGCLGAIPSGPTGGLSRRKITAIAVTLLRLSLPNQRPEAVFPRRGAQCAPAGRSRTGPCEENRTVPASA